MLTLATYGPIFSWCEYKSWLLCDSLREHSNADWSDKFMNASAMNSKSYLTRSEWLMLFSGGLGVLHHIDHILRFDPILNNRVEPGLARFEREITAFDLPCLRA